MPVLVYTRSVIKIRNVGWAEVMQCLSELLHSNNLVNEFELCGRKGVKNVLLIIVWLVEYFDNSSQYNNLDPYLDPYLNTSLAFVVFVFLSTHCIGVKATLQCQAFLYSGRLLFR